MLEFSDLKWLTSYSVLLFVCVVGVSEADKYVIVDEHNRVRSAVNNPTARDMRELVRR